MSLTKKSRIIIVLVCGIVIGLGISSVLNITPAVNSQSNQATSSTPTDFTDAIEQVAKNVGPTVVSIRTERTERYKTQRHFYGSPFGNQFGSPFGDDFFDRFFEDFFGDIPEHEYKQSGLGSGVIIDNQGYILTNQHVVEGADKMAVTLPDGREFKGTLKGTDPRSDLAVIKIDAQNLPAARLGDSDNVKIGQWVVAIGSPFGNLIPNPEPTVTAGVVSALHRSLPRTSRRDTDYTDLIQTDAAINPGNSGGPLVNLKGEIIGINVAIFSTSGGYQGVGFAIPVNTAKRIVENLIEGKEVAYGWIGVSVQNLNDSLAQYFGLPNTDGVLVSKVLEDGSAKKAGIKDGDVILSVDGKGIKNVTILLRVVGNAPVGKQVTVKVKRENKVLDIPVLITKRPMLDETEHAVQQNERKETDVTKGRWRGLNVQTLSPELAMRFQLGNSQGVIVTEVEDNTPAQEAGIRNGDIITAMNNKPIKDVQDFNSIAATAKGDCLILTNRGYFVVKGSP